jgi:hypothetical protein
LIAEALVTLRRGQFGDITESKSRIRTASCSTTSVGFWTACSPIARKLATMSDERVGAKRSIRRLLRQIGLPARRGFPDWRFTSAIYLSRLIANLARTATRRLNAHRISPSVNLLRPSSVIDVSIGREQADVMTVTRRRYGR